MMEKIKNKEKSNLQDLWQMNWLLDNYIYKLMNNSHHKFTNKPCKPHPLDNKVWKLQDIPIIIEEPIPTDESE